MYRKTDDQTRRDPAQEVTDRILEILETGVKPWVRPWNPEAAAGPQSPFNPTTGKHYRGINVLILGMDTRAFMSGDPRWMTYQQGKEKGWQVRKGEKATTIFFYKPLEVDDPEAKDGARIIPMLKSYSVFHASQVDGIPAYKAPTVEEAPWQRPEAADIILRNSGAIVRIGGGRAFYSPGTDHIQLPPENAFNGPHEWAATALHELGHWTGHKDRLNRDLSGRFGSGSYAQEELRAELASAFIGSTLGLPTAERRQARNLPRRRRRAEDRGPGLELPPGLCRHGDRGMGHRAAVRHVFRPDRGAAVSLGFLSAGGDNRLMAEIPKDRLASEELRELLGDGPPYDTAKVMAWFEQRGWALYIDLQVLEEEFFKHHPPGTARISVC